MELTTEQLEELEFAVDAEGMELVTDYSGRGMYGDRCIGVVFDGEIVGAMMRLVLSLAHGETGIADLLAESRVSRDSMGLGSIVYWPGLTAGK